MINYMLAGSLLINSILIMFVTGPLLFFLYLSVLVNIGFVFYARYILSKQEQYEESIAQLFDEVQNFSVHLEQINELETFYGDVHLQNLLNHSTTLMENMIDIQNEIYDADDTEDQDIIYDSKEED